MATNNNEAQYNQLELKCQPTVRHDLVYCVNLDLVNKLHRVLVHDMKTDDIAVMYKLLLYRVCQNVTPFWYLSFLPLLDALFAIFVYLHNKHIVFIKCLISEPSVVSIQNYRWTLQQDGAPSHTANNTINYLKRENVSFLEPQM